MNRCVTRHFNITDAAEMGRYLAEFLDQSPNATRDALAAAKKPRIGFAGPVHGLEIRWSSNEPRTSPNRIDDVFVSIGSVDDTL